MPTGSGRKSIPTRHNSGHSNLPLPESSFRPRQNGPQLRAFAHKCPQPSPADADGTVIDAQQHPDFPLPEPPVAVQQLRPKAASFDNA